MTRSALHFAAALALAAAALCDRPAEAQSVAVTDLSAIFGSVGTSAALVVPPVGDPRVPAERQTLFLANASAGATVSCGYSAAIAVNGVGTFTLAPGGAAFWPRSTAPGNAIYCIASAAATPMQVAIGN